MIQEITIPAPSVASKRFRVQLSGKIWTLDLTYQARTDRFRLGLLRPDGTAIFRGRKLVCGVDLLARYPAEDKPPGSLFAIDDLLGTFFR